MFNIEHAGRMERGSDESNDKENRRFVEFFTLICTNHFSKYFKPFLKNS